MVATFAAVDLPSVLTVSYTHLDVYKRQDQQEMALNLMQYQVAVQAGQPAVLEWHAQKESCRTFEQSEYVALSLAIADYVYPYLRYQELSLIHI